MLIGAMNHPAADVLDEIAWMADFGLGFVDLTLEPPAASVWRVDTAAIRRALDRFQMKVVGHTAFYLPIASPFESVRKAAVAELRSCVDAFASVGARWMNLHPDRHAPLHPRSFIIERNLASIGELIGYAAPKGVGIMIENLPGDFNTPEQLGELLDPLPALGLHLDAGHANLMVPGNTTEDIVSTYGYRLRHVHLHDNKGGGADLHLPLGCGSVDVHRVVRSLQDCGYDGTITLEVFTPDRELFRYSQRTLEAAWTRRASQLTTT
jgi:sugar phosphate isomerase/epimerase